MPILILTMIALAGWIHISWEIQETDQRLGLVVGALGAVAIFALLVLSFINSDNQKESR